MFFRCFLKLQGQVGKLGTAATKLKTPPMTEWTRKETIGISS
jgi:hypothetical protein